jgi:hypothetical protein
MGYQRRNNLPLPSNASLGPLQKQVVQKDRESEEDQRGYSKQGVLLLSHSTCFVPLVLFCLAFRFPRIYMLPFQYTVYTRKTEGQTEQDKWNKTGRM